MWISNPLQMPVFMWDVEGDFYDVLALGYSFSSSISWVIEFLSQIQLVGTTCVHCQWNFGPLLAFVSLFSNVTMCWNWTVSPPSLCFLKAVLTIVAH